MKVAMGKQYETREGKKVVIYAVYPINDSENVHGAVYDEYDDENWTAEEWYADGTYYADDEESPLDLVEVETTPENWKRNKPMMVRDNGGDWYKRHFCCFEGGKPTFYLNGKTSFSISTRGAGNPKRVTFKEWREPTYEELMEGVKK
jgi:hypothetical protein